MPAPAPTTAPAVWQKDSFRSSERSTQVETPGSRASGWVASATPQADQLGHRTTPEVVSACAARLSAAFAKGQPVVLATEPSLEGVLVATGITYLAHARAGQVRLERATQIQPQLGEKVMTVPLTNNQEVVEFAERVLTGFLAHVSAADDTKSHPTKKRASSPTGNSYLRRLAFAAATDDSAMPQVVYDYLRLGFAVGPKVSHMIADPRVSALDSLARYALGECEHVRQFVRFSHLSDDTWSASYAPRANVIPLMAHHFAARMGSERFCLVDPKHLVAAFHQGGQRTCTIVQLDGALAQQLTSRNDLADDERYVRVMWQHFYRGTSLPGRDRSQRGYDLRMHWMPRYLWDGLTELGDDEPLS